MSESSRRAQLVQLLGPPLRSGGEPLLDELAREWSVAFPRDYVEIAGAYGDVVISGFILFCGPLTLRSYVGIMGKPMEESATVPCRVLPSPGGALLWGNTIEGDQLFLVDRGAGRWTVSAFRRNWHDWLDTDLEFGEWFPRMLAGDIETEWMPEWPPLPHALEPVEE